jgi:hypothetical protein
MSYSYETIDTHLERNCWAFKKHYENWANLYEGIIPIAFDVASSLEGKKELAANCTYLLLSKSINHSLSVYTLSQRGLLVDASLSARNAVETFLMLELFATDESEKYFDQWAKGKSFKPAWVRRKLTDSLNVAVRDVIIKFEDDFYETVKMAYSFFSDITHSNLSSANYTVKSDGRNSFKVPTGGVIEDQLSLIQCVAVVTCSGLLRSILISSAIFSNELLEKIGPSVTNELKSLYSSIYVPKGFE